MGELTAEQIAALQAPFDPALIDYRPQGRSFTRNGELQGRVVAYVDARAVAARLDATVGPLNWQYDYDVLLVAPGKAKSSWHEEVVTVKGRLTIYGVTKCDLGDAGDSGTEPSKSAVSDGLKRAAVLWGIGRDLYDMDVEYVKAEGDDFNWRPVRGELERLRAKLRGQPAPGPSSHPAPESEPDTVPRRDWQRPGEAPRPAPPSAGPGLVTDKQLKAIYAIARAARHLTVDEVDARCQEIYKRAPSELTKQEASQLIDKLQSEVAA